MFDPLSNTQIEIELGKRLRAERLERNLTQEEVAERSGLSRRTITAIENGEGSSLSSLVALLRALGALSTWKTSCLPAAPARSPCRASGKNRSATTLPSRASPPPPLPGNGATNADQP